MTLDRIILFPYYLTLKLRDKRYSKPTRTLFQPAVPSVSVGNITVGGTGKTPHVELILRILMSSEKWANANLAVLSRGYKRESKGFQQLSVDGSAALFGDEAMQIKTKFPSITVVVDRNRVEACELLCHPERMKSDKVARQCWYRDFPAADYIILDDAFQYRKLKPAKSVVLIDFNHPVHKDCLLPLGRLRDLKERAHSADAIIVTKCPYDLDEQTRKNFVSEMGLNDYTTQTNEALSETGKRQLVLFTIISYDKLKAVFPSAEERYIYSRKAILITGIAKDTPIRKTLSDSYKIVARFSYPDHHKFVWSDINKLKKQVRRNPTAVIITTEKDACRLKCFAGLPKEISERLFMLPIEAKFLSASEEECFRDFIVG